MKCKYCGIEMTNPEIFLSHELRCLEEQKENGLIKEEKLEDGAGGKSAENDNSGDDLSKLSTEELKDLARAKGIKGFSLMKKDELLAALSE